MATSAIIQRGLPSGKSTLVLLGLGLLIMAPLMGLLLLNQLRLLVTIITLGSILLMWRLSRDFAICLNFAFLLLLGDIRRIVSVTAGEAGLDPLLLVGAVFTLFISLPILRKLRVNDSLSKVMLTLLGVMVLEIFNPKQGSIFSGLSAGLFWIVPVLWFWIGRRYATEDLVSKLLFGVVAPLGIVAGALGLYQTFIGFLPWEQAWIDQVATTSYLALFLAAGQIRAFGFSVNAIEYVDLMLVTAVAIGPLLKSRKAIYALFLPPLLVSIVLASSRTTILRVIFGFAAMWAVRGYGQHRSKVLPRVIFALLLGLAGVAYSAQHLAETDTGAGKNSTKADYATTHVIQGLAHPLDSRTSTAGAHAGMFGYGILRGITNPVGYGLGSVTLGSGKFGGEGVGSSEVDISDAFLSMGVVGGVAFLLMIVYTTRYLLEYLKYGNRQIAYSLTGIFFSMLGTWIGLGQYAIAPLMCFFIGFLTKQHMERNASVPERANHQPVAALEHA